MEYGGEVALDYSVMKNNQVMSNLSELNRLNANTVLSIKSEYSASAFKVVQPKAPANSDYG